MKITAVGVASGNLAESVRFYSLLGFKFPELTPDIQHLEPVTPEGSARLMIYSVELFESINGEKPQPGNHSICAIQYDSPEEVDEVVDQLMKSKFAVAKLPWDAFWGQRYAIVTDPDGFKLDLYAYLPSNK